MQQSVDIVLKLKIPPSKLGCVNILDLMADEYESRIYDGFYIQRIIKASVSQNGKILSDGSIVYSVNSTLDVLNPEINSTYDVIITESNKMGAVSKIGKVSVFIPKSYCPDEALPYVGSTVSATIIGKRIEGNITCIGSIIQSQPIQTQ